jgi:peptidoglycan/LPS O-acetylase OafA/YrhL
MAGMTATLDDRMRMVGGFTSGFDYMRLVLSLLVMFGHSFPISGDLVADKVMPFGLSAFVGYSILPFFFSLSGFLVAASLLRTSSLLTFLTLRGLRILPALMVEIVLSAMVLGPLLTKLPLAEYYSGHEFYLYFFNIIGWIHYNLPGVFTDNPLPRMVNGSLWTVPYEAECYLTLATLSLVGLIQRPKLLLALLVTVLAGLFVWAVLHGAHDASRHTATGRQLVFFFVAGVLVHLFRAQIPYSRALALASALIMIPLVTNQTAIYLLPLPVAYLTAYLGLQTPKKLPLLFTGDYSYGIYLYAYPMQQAVRSLWPGEQSWQFNFTLSLFAVALFAAFSWHCVEKPMLKLKRFVIRKSQAQTPTAPPAAAEPAPT